MAVSVLPWLLGLFVLGAGGPALAAPADPSAPTSELASLAGRAAALPQNADAQFELLVAALATPFPERAWPIYRRLLELDPHYPRRAVEHYGQLVRETPHERAAWLRLALANDLAGRPREAKRQLAYLIKYFPPDADTLAYAGWVAFELKQSAGAMALWRRALALQPDHVAAQWLLGQAYLRQGQQARAAQVLGSVEAARTQQATLGL
ncbi:MAG: tetratricopeptide repeat protein [Candidatus Sericytochromatia bacterium]|nr:tetratricopeptide repeat protein [Candidatus Sericytochromatia bacterium]